MKPPNEIGIVFFTPDHFAVCTDGRKIDYPKDFAPLSLDSTWWQKKTLETINTVMKPQKPTAIGTRIFPWHDYEKEDCLQNETFKRLFGSWKNYEAFLANRQMNGQRLAIACALGFLWICQMSVQ